MQKKIFQNLYLYPDFADICSMVKNTEHTFWGHLEVLRWVIVRCACVVTVLAIAIFCFKEQVFEGVVLSPCRPDFVTYRGLCLLAEVLDLPALCPQLNGVEMINIDLAAQLFVHIRVSFCLALLLAFPYLVAELWLFVSPALYPKEKKTAVRAVIAFMLLFFSGIALAYFVVFPLTLNFLGNYQVSMTVANHISLSSYISTFLGLEFIFGLVFELPVAAYFFAKTGVLTSAFLARYRKLAFVLVLVAAAMITPSTDIFTMFLVALPLQLLYEFSVHVVKRVERK